MTLDKLQTEMIWAMKNGYKFRKGVIADIIAQVKKAAIDKGCRDNIPESLVDATILKAKKTAQEMIDTCPEIRTDLLSNYMQQMEIICEFAPSVITDEDVIKRAILNSGVEMNKGKIMKYLSSTFGKGIDMGVANKVVGEMLK
jgi:uncharacterized protein YqeY